MTSTIWAYSDPIMMRTALIGVKAIMTSTPYQSLVNVFFLLALIGAIFPAMFNISTITRYYVSIFVVIVVLSMPTMDVTIVPTDDPTFGAVTVPGAPMFVALPAAIFSSSGKWMAETYEQVAFVLMALSPDLRVFGASGGMVGGSIRGLLKSTGLVPPVALSSKVSSAFDNCVIPSAVLWGDRFPTVAIENSCRTALGVVAPAKVKALDCLAQVDPLFALNNMTDPMPISTGSGAATTCDVFSQGVVTELKAWGATYATSNLETSSTSLTRNYKAVMGHLQNLCPAGACGGFNAGDILAGQGSGNLLTQSLLTSGNGASGLMTSLQAKVGAGTLAGQSLLGYMPLAMDGILAFMTLLFPIVVVVTVFSAAQGGTVSKLGNFYVGYFALSLVPSVMAVLNSFMTYYVVYKSNLAVEIASQLGGVVTSPGALMVIQSYAQAPASAMGYMMAAAPAITWAIVNTGAVPAGEMLSNMMSGGSQAAESAALSNFSANNTSTGSKSFNEKDNSNISKMDLEDTGTTKSVSSQNQKISAQSRANSLAEVKATESVTGSNVNSIPGLASATNRLATNKTSELGKSSGGADVIKASSNESGMSLAEGAAVVGANQAYVSATAANAEAQGQKRAMNEQQKKFGGIGNPSNVFEAGDALTGTAEKKLEDAQSETNAMNKISNETGTSNMRRRTQIAGVKMRNDFGDSTGQVQAAHKSGQSIQTHAAKKSFMEAMQNRGLIDSADKVQSSTGAGYRRQGELSGLASASRELGAGSAMEMGFGVMKSMGFNKDNVISSMGVAQASEFASRIGQANNTAKIMGIKGGIRGMNDEQRQDFIKLASNASVGSAVKEASEIKTGQLLSKTSSDTLSNLASGMANSDVYKGLRTGSFGAGLAEENSDGSGGVDVNKLGQSAKNAALSDTNTNQVDQEKGKSIGSVGNSRSRSQFSAAQELAKTSAAQSTYSDSRDYGDNIQAFESGELNKVKQSVAAMGGSDGYAQAMGLDGALEGRAKQAMIMARANMGQGQREAIGNLGAATALASAGAQRMNSNLSEGQEPFTSSDMSSLLSDNKSSEGYNTALGKISDDQGNVDPMFQPLMKASDALHQGRSNLINSAEKQGAGQAGHQDAIAVLGGVVNQTMSLFRGHAEGSEEDQGRIQDARNSSSIAEEPSMMSSLAEGFLLGAGLLLGRGAGGSAMKSMKGGSSEAGQVVKNASKKVKDSDMGQSVSNFFKKNSDDVGEAVENVRIPPSIPEAVENVVERAATQIGGKM